MNETVKKQTSCIGYYVDLMKEAQHCHCQQEDELHQNFPTVEVLLHKVHSNQGHLQRKSQCCNLKSL
jgi:hypothetical protein